jgi:hypothetical protein
MIAILASLAVLHLGKCLGLDGHSIVLCGYALDAYRERAVNCGSKQLTQQKLSEPRFGPGAGEREVALYPNR